MNLSEKIRALREARGLTLQDIGDVWGISRSSVAGWEAGTTKPGIDKLPGLARVLGVNVDFLLNDRSPMVEALMQMNDHAKRDLAGKLPLISYVQAGAWSEIVDNFQPGDAEDWIPCPFNHGPNAFILRVSGFSMYNPGGEKSYAPGEYIAVDPRVEPQNRKMVVAKVDGEEVATFKQLIIDPSGEMMLQALNPSHTPRVMPMPEGSRIIGVVIGKWIPE